MPESTIVTESVHNGLSCADTEALLAEASDEVLRLSQQLAAAQERLARVRDEKQQAVTEATDARDLMTISPAALAFTVVDDAMVREVLRGILPESADLDAEIVRVSSASGAVQSALNAATRDAVAQAYATLDS